MLKLIVYIIKYRLRSIGNSWRTRKLWTNLSNLWFFWFM